MSHLRKSSIYYVIFFTILLIVSCSPGDKTYNETDWKNAFKMQEISEVIVEKVGEIDDVFKSPSLYYIDENQFFIFSWKELTLNIYSRKDFKLITKVGGKGEGPGEFRDLQGFRKCDDYLFFNSPGKNSYFSLKGDLIKEVRCPGHLIPCYPIGENFVTDEYQSLSQPGSSLSEKKIVLIDSKFEIKKTLFKKKLNINMVYNPRTGKKDVKLFPKYCWYKIYKNRIFLGFSNFKNFSFTVFDENGDELYELNRPYQKKKVPKIIKESIRKRVYMQEESKLKINIMVDDYYPSFCNFEVADDRIYVFLYPESDRQRVLIMDLNGKLEGVRLLPFDAKSLERMSYQKLFYNKIFNGAKYYLKDNDETNKWEVWRTKFY